ncbi:valine--tRNA ligase [Chloroflexota bacterium]
MSKEMPKAYEPGKVESAWYSFWLEKGYFAPHIDSSKKPFVIIMPPPNVTGELHIGHALTATIQDIMIRWHRMKGDPTLWLPGVDHAGIATQWVVEQRLAIEGTSRHELGRKRFEERVWDWVNEHRSAITHQHQRLGVSCDWSREHFTLDPGPSRAVRTTFVNLYKKGLIYQGERIINWCPRCQTALSDLEVQHRELTGGLYHIRYPLTGQGEQQFVTVATTRPETLLGDTAVAVNPEDSRYHELIGKDAILPAVNRVIPIITDEAVETSFGTGVVKITPAHDPVDFEVSQRHNLPLVNIFNPDATLNDNAGPYEGMDRFEGRKAILADLEQDGLLVKTESHVHSVGHCDRCGTMVEPQVSPQWFVRIATLAAKGIQAVTEGHITIIPDRFTRVYLNWMENIRDWCISRQLWWGHRIPVWYCQRCGKETVCINDPTACEYCDSSNIEQDQDVLDTWFSSALWPHSTLGWPGDTEDLQYFYPTTVMETSYDILFFWVARMIMMGLENMGKVPFRWVYLHGLIRDEKGEKMSKVKGNVVNPIEAIEHYGTDALRFALTTGSSPGNDSNTSRQKLEAGRNFANKLWNASRFVVMTLGSSASVPNIEQNLPVEDLWILSRLNRVTARARQLMEDFQFGEAERQIHDFIWNEFCDWYIEIAKVRMRSEQPSPQPVLVHVLETSLRLLHPFMPFITEELWQRLPHDECQPDSIMIASYPQCDDACIDLEAEDALGTIMEIVRSIRNIRTQFKIPQDRWMEARIYSDESIPELLHHIPTIETLARARPVSILSTKDRTMPDKDTLTLVLQRVEVLIPLAGVVDLEKEKERLSSEIKEVTNLTDRLDNRLKDNAFLSKAPARVIEKERDKLNATQDKLMRLQSLLIQLQ